MRLVTPPSVLFFDIVVEGRASRSSAERPPDRPGWGPCMSWSRTALAVRRLARSRRRIVSPAIPMGPPVRQWEWEHFAVCQRRRRDDRRVAGVGQVAQVGNGRPLALTVGPAVEDDFLRGALEPVDG